MIHPLRLTAYRSLPWQGYLVAIFQLSGWTLGTALAVAGSFVAGMFLLSEPTLVGLFNQLAALSTHYVTATPDRQALFDRELAIGSVPVTALVGWFRRAGLRAILNDLTEAHNGRR